MPLQNEHSPQQTHYIKTTLPTLRNTGSITPIRQMADSFYMSSANPTNQQLDPDFVCLQALSFHFLVPYSRSQEVMWGKQTTNLNSDQPCSFSYWPKNNRYKLRCNVRIHSSTLPIFTHTHPLCDQFHAPTINCYGHHGSGIPLAWNQSSCQRQHTQIRQRVLNLVITRQLSQGLIVHSLPPLGIYNMYSPCSSPTMHSLQTRAQ
jgi:hypothetical protein